MRQTILTLVCYLVVIANASAYATLEGPPTPSSASGLPDDRVYELVSPQSKNGNEAGAGTAAFDVGALNHYGIATPSGNAVLFEGTGPMGESPWGASLWFVAERNTSEASWNTRAVLPRAEQSLDEVGGTLKVKGLYYLDPSSDLSHAMVQAGPSQTLAPQVNEACRNQLYLTGSHPLMAAEWLEEPSAASREPIENCAASGESGAPAGGAADFSTVYFTYPGTLLPEDSSRISHAGSGGAVEAWGFYEKTGGSLREAGVLPDGSLDPFGAVPAASGHGTNRTGNEISSDGRRAFFVSPDPASCEQNGGHNNCTVDPPQLYVRENGEKSQLVSQDQLQSSTQGAVPTSAPRGVLRMPNPTHEENGTAAVDGSYVFASPDGTQAFFQSDSVLTKDAEEISPGIAPKTYDFDVNTGVLTYLPNVAGEILATSADGSELAFLRPETAEGAAELEIWSRNGSGETVTPVVRVPGETVPEARMSNNGAVVVFQTPAEVSPQFQSDGWEEVYRYDYRTRTLGCVSCPPPGVTPHGNASISALRTGETLGNLGEAIRGTVDERGIASNGERIFFESPDPLVPQDVNTNSPEVPLGESQLAPQGRDVYEWENGEVYLISTGRSPRNSFLIDSSENGDNVFFATAEGLVPSDTDGGYDVYDARVSEVTLEPPVQATPCDDSACQGPALWPVLATEPASASVSGNGNQLGEVISRAGPAGVTQRSLKCRRGYVRRNRRCVKRHRASKAAARSAKS